MKILVADDDPVSRRRLEGTLARWGHQVVAVADGAEGWKALQAEDAPQIAILDWQMPGMDGPAVCRSVRERAQDAYVYLILLTGKNGRADFLEGMDAGADDYLTKPFDAAELRVRLGVAQRILHLHTALLQSLSDLRKQEEQLEKARKQEVDIGGRIQRALLLGEPPNPLPRACIAALSIPSESIDGDFYDFFKHTDRCLDLVVGDVMGKGIPAALLGAALKSYFLRALNRLMFLSERQRLPEPEEIVALVHREVTGQFIGLERYITLCYVRFHLEERRLDLVDCGHTATLHFQRATGICRKLQGDNMPLGFSENEVYRQVSFDFDLGDLFFFYSDGVTEAKDAAGALFGIDRLVELITTNGTCDPDELNDRVRRAVVAYSHCETFCDDLTCVALKIEGSPPLAQSSMALDSSLSELPALRAFVRKFCQEIRPAVVKEEVLQALELAASEVGANIIRHAYHSRSGQPLQAAMEAFPDHVTLCLSHYGETFDPNTVPPPSFDGSRDGGFGLYFVSKSVDDVRYSTDVQGRHTICLTKRLVVSGGSG